jgi:activator of 2-hydroxyglutaryl-CoA dehydratase
MAEPLRFGVDLGSSYVKVVGGSSPEKARLRRVGPTGVDYASALQRLLPPEALAGTAPLTLTGYGKHGREQGRHRSEVACLARAFLYEGHGEGTLVDIGGQDTKILRFAERRLKDFHLNRRCAAGTGSFAEFLMHRMRLTPRKLDAFARQAREAPRLNQYCTVFAATEVIDLVQKGTPLSAVARSVYVSVALRVKEVGPLTPPVFVCGGFAAHHPVFPEILQEVTGFVTEVVPHPKFYAAYGAYLFSWEGSE